MLNQLREWLRGPQGIPGPSGPRGLRGLQGPPGRDYRPGESILPLPLDVVAVTASQDMDYLWSVKRAIIKSQDWWLENLGIRLQSVLSVLKDPGTPKAFWRADIRATALHYMRSRGAMLSAYVVDTPTLDGDLWGTAVGYHGFVVVVGQNEDLIGPLIAHELGHMFFDDDHHEENTFMRLHTQAHDNFVTPEQRAWIRGAL